MIETRTKYERFSIVLDRSLYFHQGLMLAKHPRTTAEYRLRPRLFVNVILAQLLKP